MDRMPLLRCVVVVAATALVCVLSLHSLVICALLLAVLWLPLGPLCVTPLDLPIVLGDVGIAVAQFLAAMAVSRGQPRFPEWTVRLELMQRVAQRVFTKYGATLVRPLNAQRMRSLQGRRSGASSCKASDTTLVPVVVDGLEHLWLRSSTPVAPALERFVVLYIHGGGYTLGHPRAHIDLANRARDATLTALRQGEASKLVDVQVFMANYRKAPDVQFPVPQQDVVQAFEYVRDELGVPPARIIIMGDSAGGGLVLSALLRLRDDKKATLPRASVLLYPWADLTLADDPDRGRHCILSPTFLRSSVQALLPNCNDPSAWKDASAVHCDLRGLPPTLIQVGTADYLYQDSVKLFHKATSDGASNWQLDERPNLPHGFLMMQASVVPGTEPAFARIGEFIAKQIVGIAGATKTL